MIKLAQIPSETHRNHFQVCVEARCSCGRKVALCAATYVSFCNDEGMKATEAQATAVLLNCHALEHGQFAQTLMVSLFPAQVAA